MTCLTARKIIRSFTVLSLLSWIGATAGASAIPSYTVTDLGAVWDDKLHELTDIKLSAPTGADATLTASDGRTVYAFPRSDNSVAHPQTIYDKLPPYANGELDYLHKTVYPLYVYSVFTGDAMLNRNGVFAAVDTYGESGASGVSMSEVFTTQRRADGSFGPLIGQFGTTNNVYSHSGQVATILDLNNRDQILGISAPPNSYPGARTFVLDDLKSGQITDISQLMPGWTIEYRKMALDDQGRILAYGSSAGDGYKVHALLLRPADPIATPEPSTLATMAVAVAGLAIRRLRR